MRRADRARRGGVQHRQPRDRRLSPPGRPLAADTASGGLRDGPTLGHPGRALERDMVEQLQAKNSFLANVAVFRTADAMTGGHC